ncbi:MAG: LysE family transporter [Alphaproteobacteria bacterium]|nr:LysE family transporter [Alphaproteobacteria bacterium]
MFADLLPYIDDFLKITVIYVVVLVTPGPDFTLVIRNTLTNNKKMGLYTAFGSATGIIVHGSYTLLGMGVLVQRKPLIFNGVKMLGALYLMYMGWRCVRSPSHMGDAYTQNSTEHAKKLTPFQAWRMAFLTDILNPMLIVLFLAIFSTVIRPETPPLIQSLFVLQVTFLSFLWFSLVALFFSSNHVRSFFTRLGLWFDRVAGGILFLLGLKIVWDVWGTLKPGILK